MSLLISVSMYKFIILILIDIFIVVIIVINHSFVSDFSISSLNDFAMISAGRLKMQDLKMRIDGQKCRGGKCET